MKSFYAMGRVLNIFFTVEHNLMKSSLSWYRKPEKKYYCREEWKALEDKRNGANIQESQYSWSRYDFSSSWKIARGVGITQL